MKTFTTLLTFCLFFSVLAYSQTVKINEFMASNGETITDLYGDYEDWIELYNYGSDTVDVGGLYITDILDMPMRHRIPAGYEETKIPPGGFLLLWASNDTLKNGVLDLDFRLSKSGEAVGLFALDGITPIDTIVFGQQIRDVSYGRYPDGADYWVFFNYPTPGSSNSLVNIDKVTPLENNITVFPNPVTHNYVFLSEYTDFEVYDSQGRLVGTYKNTKKLNTVHMSNGHYFIKTFDKKFLRFLINR